MPTCRCCHGQFGNLLQHWEYSETCAQAALPDDDIPVENKAASAGGTQLNPPYPQHSAGEDSAGSLPLNEDNASGSLADELSGPGGAAGASLQHPRGFGQTGPSQGSVNPDDMANDNFVADGKKDKSSTASAAASYSEDSVMVDDDSESQSSSLSEVALPMNPAVRIVNVGDNVNPIPRVVDVGRNGGQLGVAESVSLFPTDGNPSPSTVMEHLAGGAEHSAGEQHEDWWVPSVNEGLYTPDPYFFFRLELTPLVQHTKPRPPNNLRLGQTKSTPAGLDNGNRLQRNGKNSFLWGRHRH